MPDDFARHFGGLNFAARESDNLDGRTKGLAREQDLTETAVLAADNAVGGREDMASAAEVFLKADLRGAGKVPREPADIGYVRAAPSKYRLIIVTDCEDFLMPGTELSEPGILGSVHVLIFVGKNSIEAA